jgi:hypothetical protein
MLAGAQLGVLALGAAELGTEVISEAPSGHGWVPKGSGEYTIMTVKPHGGEIFQAVISRASPYSASEADGILIEKTFAYLAEKV